ncbi:MAG: flagellar basal body L-ring protein FlgH [Burkholderiales bacterium]
MSVRNSLSEAISRIGACAITLVALAGCASGGHVKMHEPLTARPKLSTVTPTPTDGAIFQGGRFFQPLFEDRRARTVGDILIVQINEKLSASQQSQSSANRVSSADMSIPLIKGIPFKTLQDAGIGASGDQKFEGKGGTSNNNVFSGSISVTVIDVLANGNLVIAGDKQIGINHNAETLRFSGIVNPVTIQSGNTLNSTQVAEARLEYVGSGYIDEAQSMPWLQRIFMNILPF